MPGREVHAAVVVEATRPELWALLTTERGLTSWLAPGVDLHAIETGHWRPAFDTKGKNPMEDGEILRYARDQELIIRFPAPAVLRSLQGESVRLHFRIEPLAYGLQRVRVFVDGFGEGDTWNRLADHLQVAWESALERLRSRLALHAPSIGDYDGFWAGL